MERYKVINNQDNKLHMLAISRHTQLYGCNGHKIVISLWSYETLGQAWVEKKLSRFQRYAKRERRHSNG